MTATAATKTDDAYEPDPNRWKALTVCLVAGFMTLLDVSIVNVALPSIQKGIGAGENELSWVVSGYALTFGLLLVPAGRIGDARGRRPVFMVGVLLFVIASAACGFAPDPLFLIVARLIQGFAGGLVTPQVSGLIQSLFRGQERAKAFGFFGLTVGVSTAVGPLLGGVIIGLLGDTTGWRYVFFVNLPIGIAALPLARTYIPPGARDRGAKENQDLDPIGVGLLGVAVACVIVPFIEQQSWHSPIRPLLFPVAAVAFVAFLVWERQYRRKGSHPVVDFTLFTRMSYSAGTVIGLLYFAGFTGIFFIYTQTLQDGFGYSALRAGLAVTPFAFGGAATATLGGKYVTRLGRPLIVAGLAMVLIGLVGTYLAATAVTGTDLGWAAAAPLLFAGLGSGLVITPNQTLTLSQVPVKRAGVAGGVLQTGQRIGSAAGIAVTSSVFYGALMRGRNPDWSLALERGLVVIGAFVGVSFVLALVDAIGGRRAVGRGRPSDRGTGTSRAGSPEGRHAA